MSAELSTSSPFEPADDLAGFDAVRASIMADLDRRQGPAVRAPVRTMLRITLPTLAVVIAAFVLLPPLRDMGASVVVAGAAALLALCAVAVAPARPALGERLAQLAVPIALFAFAAELWRMVPGGATGAAACFGSTAAVASLAAVVVAAGLWSSGLPLRTWHTVGVGVVAVVGACTAVWHHCRSDELLHVIVSHVSGPLLLVGLIVVVVRRRQAARAGA